MSANERLMGVALPASLNSQAVSVDVRSIQVSDSKFSPIVEIAYTGAGIWHDDKKGDRRKRHRDVADILLPHLTPAILSDPQFYRSVPGEVHMFALELLASLFPEQQEDLGKFKQSREHKTIVSYLKGIVENPVTIFANTDKTRKDLDGQGSYYKERLEDYLGLRGFAAIPKGIYLHSILKDLGPN